MEDKKIVYIDDVKDQIVDIIRSSFVDNETVANCFKEREIHRFVNVFNKVSENADRKFIYKFITLVTTSGSVINALWNFKRDFPIFIIGQQKMRNRKYLDENFCMPAPTPPELQELLNEFKSKIK